MPLTYVMHSVTYFAVEQRIAQDVKTLTFQVHEVFSTMLTIRHPLVVQRIVPVVKLLVREQGISLPLD